MSKIFEPLNLKHFTLKNRIVMPAMVTFGFGIKDGLITDELVEYYAQRAAGGVGMIFIEAACIDEKGKLAHAQIGIWNDGQLDGHKKLTERIHRYDLPVISQLHHAGVKSVMGDARGLLIFPERSWKKTFPPER